MRAVFGIIPLLYHCPFVPIIHTLSEYNILLKWVSPWVYAAPAPVWGSRCLAWPVYAAATGSLPRAWNFCFLENKGYNLTSQQTFVSQYFSPLDLSSFSRLDTRVLYLSVSSFDIVTVFVHWSLKSQLCIFFTITGKTLVESPALNQL